MSAIHAMISATRRQADLDVKALAECLIACGECAIVCTMCADACVSESHVSELRRCIRLNLDCAALCNSVERLLSRASDPDSGSMRALLEACASACQACAAECEKHGHEEHCQICAKTCARCARACQEVLNALLEGPTA